MAEQPSKLRAWAQLGRVSNLPTVWSNCLVGAALAGAVEMRLDRLGVAMAGGSLLYVAGMILNDWFDRRLDARERPNRPIPAGRISSAAALFVGLLLLAAGIASLAWLGPITAGLAGVLAILILTYNALHSYSVALVLVLGVCRGLVLAISASCQAAPSQWNPYFGLIAAALVAYVVALSLFARDETRVDGAMHSAPFVLSGLIPVALLAWLPFVWWMLPIAAFAIGWTLAVNHSLRFARISRIEAVMRLLAGICLLDACFLARLQHAPSAIAALGCFALTVAFQRRIAGS